MSNNEELEQERKFANWLNDKSDDVDLAEESPWQQRKNTTDFIKHQVAMSRDVDVPSWNRASGFHSDKVPFWQWQGLSVISTALSMFAIALVLFKVELVVQDGSVLVSFTGNNAVQQDKKVAELVNEKLREFAQEQQVVLANYAADIKGQQQSNNLQLASYIIDASRQERKEDITDFIQYISAQRKDELLEHRIKYQQLEQAIKYSKSYKQENINGFGLQEDDSTPSTATWISEE